MSFLDWPNLIAGFVLGLIPSLILYYLSGRDLVKEAARLRRHTSLLTQALQQGGIGNFSYDANGEPTGLVIKVPKAEMRLEAPPPKTES